MATSFSSGSSFASSGHTSTFSHNYSSSINTTWTAASNATSISAVTSHSSIPDPQSSPRSLDLGPPAYYAIITIFENTPYERTVYLGPWKFSYSEHRLIRWQCSDHSERLEHYLPLESSVDLLPHTLHAKHRPYVDPSELERFVSFREPHHVRYITGEGVLCFDNLTEVKYEFTTVEGAIQFQSDLRNKDLVDYFDLDVVWSDVHGRTDGFGNIKGMGLVQRMKLWRDRATSLHTLTVLANRSGGRHYHEYEVLAFESELKSRDDRHRQIRLAVRPARRGAASDGTSTSSHGSRRFSLSQRLKSRSRSSSGSGNQTSSISEAHATGPPLDIRYLGLQFTKKDDYKRFIDNWAVSQALDSQSQVADYPGHEPGYHTSTLATSGSFRLGGPLSPVLEPAELDNP